VFMVLEKKALCRVLIKSPDNKIHYWCGSVYADNKVNDVGDVIERVKKVLE